MTTAHEFKARLAVLLSREHAAMADLLVALAEFDRKRLWIDLGHANLFSFLSRDLGLSNGAAYLRKEAARLVQRFPEVIEPLRDGRLCLSTIGELSKVLTKENRGEVLPRFFHRSKKEAAAVAAEIRPAAAPLRDVVTPVRAPARSEVVSVHAGAPRFASAAAQGDAGQDGSDPFVCTGPPAR